MEEVCEPVKEISLFYLFALHLHDKVHGATVMLNQLTNSWTLLAACSLYTTNY